MSEVSQNSSLALLKSGRGAGVLILHAWWRLNDFFKDLCQRLAQEGFVALAPDLYHGKIATTVEEARQLRSKLNQKQVGTDILSAVEQLHSLPSVTSKALGVVGFSWGVKKLEKNLHNAHRPATLYTYEGTEHWFFEQDRTDAYNREAARLSWTRTVEFFRTQLGK